MLNQNKWLAQKNDRQKSRLQYSQILYCSKIYLCTGAKKTIATGVNKKKPFNLIRRLDNVLAVFKQILQLKSPY